MWLKQARLILDMETLPRRPLLGGKVILIVILSFLIGAGGGAGGMYFYTTKVIIPKYQKQMETAKSQWDAFFQQGGAGEYTNPFGTEGTGGTTEEYVNPFDLIGE